MSRNTPDRLPSMYVPISSQIADTVNGPQGSAKLLRPLIPIVIKLCSSAYDFNILLNYTVSYNKRSIIPCSAALLII